MTSTTAPARRKYTWTRAEDRRLMFLWESGLRLHAVARRMRRTQIGCYRRAAELGLRVGCPAGYEYVEAAAVRTGFATKTLRRVLEAAGVRFYQSLSDPTIKRRGFYRRHYVIPEAVDAAIRDYLETEPIAAAARARGLSDDTLRRWLIRGRYIEENEIGANGTRRRVPRRLESFVIDQAAADCIEQQIARDHKLVSRLNKKLAKAAMRMAERVAQVERLRGNIAENRSAA